MIQEEADNTPNHKITFDSFPSTTLAVCVIRPIIWKIGVERSLELQQSFPFDHHHHETCWREHKHWEYMV